MSEFLRVVLLILVITILLSSITVGCKRADSTVIDELSDYIFVADYITLPGGMGEHSNYIYNKDKLYFTVTNIELGSEENNYLSSADVSIYSINIDGTDLMKLPDYVPPVKKPENAGGFVYISEMSFDNEGFLWVVEDWYFYNNDDSVSDKSTSNNQHREYTEINESGCFIRKLDTSGKEQHVIDISYIAQQEHIFVDSLFIARTDYDDVDEQYVFLRTTQPGIVANAAIYVVDHTGEIKLQIDTKSNSADNFIFISDNSVIYSIFSYYEDSKRFYSIQSLNTISLEMNSEIIVPASITGDNDSGTLHFLPVGELGVLVSDNFGVYNYIPGDNRAKKILDWQESNVIYNNLRKIISATENQLLCIVDSFDDAAQVDLIILTKTLRTEIPEKTIIKLATFNTDITVSNAVAEFNIKNPDYRIDIIDYSQYNSYDNPDAGYVRFTGDITSGNIPDIICPAPWLPYTDYVADGLFTNLYSFIDSDQLLSRSDFIQVALHAAETNGGLYQLPTGFVVFTVAGHPSIVGQESNWTIDEFLATLDMYPNANLPMGARVNKLLILVQLISLNLDNFLNIETGTVNFNNEGFIKLLEISNKFPYEPDVNVSDIEAITAGQQIMIYTAVSDFCSYQRNKTILGGQIVFKGFPVDNGTGSFAGIDNLTFSIFEQSQNKELAWSFIRRFTDSNWQHKNVNSFPSTKAAFDLKLEREINWMIENSGIKERDYIIEEPSQVDLDMIISLIHTASITPAWSSDVTLLNIILDISNDFFNSIISAEEAALNIQNSVSLFVSERR